MERDMRNINTQDFDEEPLEEPTISYDKILQKIKDKTTNIHAAFLFWGNGKLLQKLSLHLCATRRSNHYNGWPELGIKIGLESIQVRVLETIQIIHEDPVFIMFEAYSQQDDATIAKIYIGIDEIKRPDVIMQTYPFVVEFYDDIYKKFKNSTNQILKPPEIPKPLHIFKNLDTINHSIEEENTITNKTRHKYKKIIMLTYVLEDAKIAYDIATELRKERKGEKIGVVVLNELEQYVLTDREKIVLKFYTNSHYILPIVTKNYLKKISKSCAPCSSALDNLDGAYAPFIYDLMTNHYSHSGFKNKKIRCIIPDQDFIEVQNHEFFLLPIFQAWVKLSNISNMAKSILKGKI